MGHGLLGNSGQDSDPLLWSMTAIPLGQLNLQVHNCDLFAWSLMSSGPRAGDGLRDRCYANL